MIRNPGSIVLAILIGFVFATSAVTRIINASYAKGKKLWYEVYDCYIIGSSAYWKNGPCLGSGSEKENSMLPENAIPESPISKMEQTDPFGPVIK